MANTNFRALFLIFILIVLMSSAQFVDEDNSLNINILLIHEEHNFLALDSVTTAVQYAKDAFNLTIGLTAINVTNEDNLQDEVCSRYNDLLNQSSTLHGVINTLSKGSSSTVTTSYIHSLGIPTVSLSPVFPNLKDVQKTHLLNIKPPTETLLDVISLVAKHMRTRNAVILYDDNFDFLSSTLDSLFQNMNTRHIITKLANADQRHNQIDKFANLAMDTFFIAGSPQSVSSVIESVNPKYLKNNYVWYAISPFSGNISCNCTEAKLTVIRPAPKNVQLSRFRMLQQKYNLSDQPELMSAFYFDLSVRTFLAVNNVIVSGKWPQDLLYNFCPEFNATTANQNIDFYSSFSKVSEPTSYSTFKLVNPKLDFNESNTMEIDMEITQITIRNGIFETSHVIGKVPLGPNSFLQIYDFGKINSNTPKLMYHISTAVQAPFIIKDPTSPKGYKGYCIDMIDKIAAIVKFNYTISEADDGHFGSIDSNGEWTGIIRELMDKRADIGLTSLSVMAERENVIDFTVPFYDWVGLSIMMMRPSTTPSLFKFLSVLETTVWLCVLAAFFLASILMWMFERWSPFSYRNLEPKLKQSYSTFEFSLKGCLWFCITSITPQGGGDTPVCLSGRLVAATWWLFAYIMVASYTANLSAFLTVSRLETQIDSIDDLYNQNNFQYFTWNVSLGMSYFRRMAELEDSFYEIWKSMRLNDSLTTLERSKLAVWEYPLSYKYTKMWQAMQETGFPNDLDSVLARVRQSTSTSGFAYIGDTTDILNMVATNCDMQNIGKEFSKRPYAIAVQKGSPLRDQLNNAILTLINRRSLETLKKKWWTLVAEQGNCGNRERTNDEISIHNIGGVFVVIVLGILATFLTLCWRTYRRKVEPGNEIVAESSPSQQVEKNDSNTINRLDVTHVRERKKD